jgi:hypothetical protein
VLRQDTAELGADEIDARAVGHEKVRREAVPLLAEAQPNALLSVEVVAQLCQRRKVDDRHFALVALVSTAVPVARQILHLLERHHGVLVVVDALLHRRRECAREVRCDDARQLVRAEMLQESDGRPLRRRSLQHARDRQKAGQDAGAAGQVGEEHGA